MIRLSVRFTAISDTDPIVVESITCAIYQSSTLIDLRRSSPTRLKLTARIPIFTKGTPDDMLMVLSPQQTLTEEIVIRLPDDLILSPTTLPATITPNRGSHEIFFEVIFRGPNGERKTVRHREGVMLACVRINYHSR